MAPPAISRQGGGVLVQTGKDRSSEDALLEVKRLIIEYDLDANVLNSSYAFRCVWILEVVGPDSMFRKNVLNASRMEVGIQEALKPVYQNAAYKSKGRYGAVKGHDFFYYVEHAVVLGTRENPRPDNLYGTILQNGVKHGWMKNILRSAKDVNTRH